MANCEEKVCTGTVGPDFPSNQGTTGPQSSTNGCITTSSGVKCPTPPVSDPNCNPFQLTDDTASCFIDSVVNESLNIAGADLHVYKLLGVHEQCKLTDVTGNGRAISNGSQPHFPASYAFDIYKSEWRSVQRGEDVITLSAIGYDFGEIKTSDNSRRRYGINANVRKHITAIAIKQSSDSLKRATKVRIERSDNCEKWYGVAVVDLPDNDCLNTILFNDSVPMRFWRLRPVAFNGGANDYWGVQAIKMYHNYIATNEDNIQDKILFENRDRDYAEEPILLKGSYDLLDISTELSRFGIEIPSATMQFSIGFTSCVALLGRPLIIGDIIEVPSEAQYTPTMQKIKRWVEVTDVAWATTGYTPGWQPTLLKVTAQPAFASQETQDIFGDLAENKVDSLGLMDKGNGKNPNYQDYSDIEQTIQSLAADAVPEAGEEYSSVVRQWEPEELAEAAKHGILPNLMKIGQVPTPFASYLVEDAMPPNNAPFTEGPIYPTSPKHGDYHRLIYEGLSKDVPAQLYRYSQTKGRWVYLESDRRAAWNSDKPVLEEFLRSPDRKPITFVTRDNPDECKKEENN